MLTRVAVQIPWALVFAFLLVAGSSLQGAEIRWTGNATIRYAGGNDIQTAPTLGAPVLTLAAPGSMTVASGFGWTWNLALVESPKQYIEVRVGALPHMKAEVIATNRTLVYQQTQHFLF